MEQTAPRVGQYLYASCSAEDYGKIIAIGKDGNGVNCIDIEVYNPDDLLSFNDENESSPALTHIELPKGVRIILRNVQYKNQNWDWAYGIECNTPGNNCYRCTKSFIVKDEPVRPV